MIISASTRAAQLQSSLAKKPVVMRKAVTETEKAHQRSLAKIKRLNIKLSKIKSITVNMSTVASKTNQVSSRQVEDWAKKVLAILNNNTQ